MFWKTSLYLLLFLCLIGSIFANTQTVYPFSSSKDQERFDQFINQTRCLVCKNQTIAESNAHLAKDLRQKIHQLIRQGYSDQDIQNYLVIRYGDFILFKPSFKPTTYFLWLTPFILLFLILCCLFYVLYQRGKIAKEAVEN